jgi:hypothetical protein
MLVVPATGQRRRCRVVRPRLDRGPACRRGGLAAPDPADPAMVAALDAYLTGRAHRAGMDSPAQLAGPLLATTAIGFVTLRPDGAARTAGRRGRHVTGQVVEGRRRSVPGWRSNSFRGCPPDRHHRAMTGSQIAQPTEECRAKGRMGTPRIACTMSQQACISQATPIQR